MKTQVEQSEILLSQIRSGKEGRDATIKSLYTDDQLRGGIRKVIRQMGGTQELADDMMSNAIMMFVKTVISKNEFALKSSVNNYIIGIAKYSYLNELKKRDNQHASLTDYQWKEDDGAKPIDLIVKKETYALLSKLLSQLGRNCKEVLMLWASDYKMESIAEQLKYKSGNMAKKKKYECFKTLMKILQENPQIKEALR